MKYMTSDEIREKFLQFFEQKNHKKLPSSPLVPSDPQLMFTVAGMVPFKPIFWGKVEPTHTMITTCQKCIRTNDIENVGKTARHQTFFEMLGNFSFGEYFKKEAIPMAWEFLTKVLEMPEEKLWPSVYIEDNEAYEIWKKIVPEERIMKFDKSENWWGPVGPTGPCGPSSEIYFDTGFTDDCPDVENCTPACDCGRFVEIWNIVFTEYYAKEDGSFEPLARKNIDTGAGLERIVAAIQGVKTNFDTDLFKEIIEKIENTLNVKYGKNSKTDTSIKVIADHARAVSFIIAEGILPSNEGRGYVLRRILRRSIRHANLLGTKTAFFSKIIDSVIEKYEKIYPELIEKQDFIKKIVNAEEERFLQTLEKGLERLNNIIKKGKISGADAFELYDTYGFPFDITEEIAEEKNIPVDKDEYLKLMKEQKERARKATGNKEYAKSNKAYKKVGDDLKTTEFTGYNSLNETEKVLYIIKGEEIINEANENEEVELIFSKTPFYAEKGGQIADIGTIKNTQFEAQVKDVQIVYNEVISHKVIIKKGKIKVGDKVELTVDINNRNAIKRNHSATHLLHSALRNIVGNHIKQAGSYVSNERLRFDITHYESLTKEQIQAVETLVNEEILKATPVITEVKSLNDAKNENVIALFEEKYGNEVRIVKMGEFSKELCGGTHVSNTGEIGLFKILTETSVSAGIRRIEAITGLEALKFTQKQEKIINNLNSILNTSTEKVEEKVQSLLKTIKEKESTIKELEAKTATANLLSFIDKGIEIDGFKIVVGVLENVSKDIHRNATDTLLSKIKDGVVILFNKSDKLSFTVKVSKNALNKFHAGQIAKKIATHLGGGGGGRPDFAQAGGKDPSKIPEIIKNIQNFIK
ncbi:alanine--tRNA ligase [Tepiditoga spiralis]|uniref:Alanine--tRNA ligase n=1 Tax=Tepiditoga spiralis TaxID=2108365 RepID=A0A7G1G986_9BACT|nr:alanine--tRNA ligase [Tepiditoga spiralis]BBE30652.1 alanine--tRNA ligase [Tepiditoga spiralis]